jgi:hypothetical protein
VRASPNMQAFSPAVPNLPKLYRGTCMGNAPPPWLAMQQKRCTLRERGLLCCACRAWLEAPRCSSAAHDLRQTAAPPVRPAASRRGSCAKGC